MKKIKCRLCGKESDWSWDAMGRIMRREPCELCPQAVAPPKPLRKRKPKEEGK